MKVVLFIAMIISYLTLLCQSSIYSPRDTLTYSVIYDSDTCSSLDIIQLVITGNKWKHDNSQIEAVYLYDKMEHDSEYFKGIKSIGWVKTDTTGIVNDSTKCWIHPPRHNHLRIMELSPFPRVQYPLVVGERYALMLVIGDGWEELSFSQIMWVYEIMDEKDGVWTINATATPQQFPDEINRLTFTFSQEKGFIELYYKFHSGVKVEMKLLN